MGHIPVLLPEVIHAFEGKELKVFFEGTVGAGGHAKAILQAHPEIERYFACDRDAKAIDLAQKVLKPWWEKVEWVQGPFAEVDRYLKKANLSTIDGFFIDIGVSSMQFDEGSRGFSFRVDAPLDMRMDQGISTTAEDLINELPEVELARIFFEYGEEFRSRAAAKAIVAVRKRRKIRTTFELIEILEPILRKGKIHFATKVFQALRIAVNDELGQLKNGLMAAIDHLAPGGRIAVISFHSLEDRIVKNIFKEGSARPKKGEKNGKLPILELLTNLRGPLTKWVIGKLAWIKAAELTATWGCWNTNRWLAWLCRYAAHWGLGGNTNLRLSWLLRLLTLTALHKCKRALDVAHLTTALIVVAGAHNGRLERIKLVGC